jgi:uncharacterized protein YjbJ (UPF0337 family)
MNWDQVEGKWKQVRGKVKERWGKLRDSDLDVIRGRRDQLIGKVQEIYGVVREKAERQVAEFENGLFTPRPGRAVKVRVRVVRRRQSRQQVDARSRSKGTAR